MIRDEFYDGFEHRMGRAAVALAVTGSLSHYPKPAVHIMQTGTYGEESREIKDIGIELLKRGQVAL